MKRLLFWLFYKIIGKMIGYFLKANFEINEIEN